MQRMLKVVWNVIKEHRIALVFAILAGTLSVAPHLLAVHALQHDYQGFPFLMSDNEDYYLARTQEIRDGHGTVASPYFFEYKNILPVVPTIGEYLYVIPGFITRLSSTETLVFAKFLFPAILFLLIFTLIRTISEENDSGKKNIWGALAGAGFIVMGFNLVDYHTLFERLLGIAEHQRFLSPWVRPVNPITGALFLFTYLHLLWRSMKEERWIFPIFGGILIALSLGYVFTVAIELTVLGFLILLSWYKKAYARLKRLGVILCVGMGIASLYWFRVIETLSGGSGMAEKNGLMHTHAPIMNKVLLATSLLIALMFFFIRHRAKQGAERVNLQFVTILLLSGFVVLNQQLLTGITIWPYHFTQYTNPLAIVSLCIAGYVLWEPYFPRMWKIFSVSILGMSVCFALWNASTYVSAMQEFQGYQRMVPLFAWINSHAEKDCVILSVDDDNEMLTGFIPGFTSCNVYQTKNFVSGSTPEERVRFNFFVLLRLRGIDATNIDPYLETHQELVLRYFYTDYQELFGLVHNDHIATITPALANEYREFLKKDFAGALKQYRIDYLLSKEELPSGVATTLAGHLTPLFSSGSSTIYAFK